MFPLHAMAWAMYRVPLGSYFQIYIYIYILSTWAVSLRVDFWRNYQSFWENVFKAKLKNGSNFIICSVRKKFFFELVFHSFIPKLGYRFSTAKFRLLRHCFPAFCRVDQLYGSWNFLFPEFKRKTF